MGDMESGPTVTTKGDAFAIGEPVSCERCGETVRCIERYGGVEVYHGGIVSGYVTDELRRIGDGNWSIGVLRVTRGSLDNPCPLGGERKPYARREEMQ